MKSIGVEERILENIEGSRQELIRFLQDLIRIPSPVGEEHDVQMFVADKLKAMGLELDIWEPDVEEVKQYPDLVTYPVLDERGFKGRPVAVGTLKGSGGGRSLMLQGHLDVMPAGNLEAWTHDPWSGVIEGDRMYGRGTNDMKGGVAAMIMALESVVKAGVKLKGDVIVESVIDEEQGGASTLACCARGYKADAAIITEPTECQIEVATEGFHWADVKITGKQAHCAHRWEGVSALEKGCKIYEAIEALQNYREQKVSHPAYDRTRHPYFVPLVVGAMQAGVGRGSVPGEAILKCRIGFLPNEGPEAVFTEFQEQIKNAAALDPWMREHPPEIERIGTMLAADIDMNHPIVASLQRSYKMVTGEEPILTGSTGANEQRLLVHRAGTPTLVFGPIGAGAHSPNEYVVVESVLTVAKSIALTILDWCGF